MLALEPNHEVVRGNFLARVLARSLPASLSITAALFVAIVAGRILGFGFSQLSTVCTVLTAEVGILLIIRISQPMTMLRRALVIVVAAIMAVGCTVAAPVFRIAAPTLLLSTLEFVLGVCTLVLFWWLYNRSLEDLEKGGPLSSFVAKLEDSHVKPGIRRAKR